MRFCIGITVFVGGSLVLKYWRVGQWFCVCGWSVAVVLLAHGKAKNKRLRCFYNRIFSLSEVEKPCAWGLTLFHGIEFSFF